VRRNPCRRPGLEGGEGTEIRPAVIGPDRHGAPVILLVGLWNADQHRHGRGRWRR